MIFPKFIYGWLFVFLFPFGFLSLAINYPSVLWITLTVLATISVALPFRYCGVHGRMFGDSLGSLAAPYCSGCGNITVLYIWFIIFPFFCYAVWLSILGLSQGPEVSRARWNQLVDARLSR